MGLIALDCTKCGARLEIDEGASTYTCKYCHTAHERDYSKGAAPTPQSLRVMAERAIANAEYGKAMQFIEQGLAIDPDHAELLALEIRAREGLASLSENRLTETEEALKQTGNRGEAERYHLQAQLILHELQANKMVYGSNSSLRGASPANVDLALDRLAPIRRRKPGARPPNVDLALQYIDRSLELFPDSPVYLNLKALLLWEGKHVGRKVVVPLLEKAAALNPRDIDIQNNLKALKPPPAGATAESYIICLVGLIVFFAIIFIAASIMTGSR